MDQAEIVSCMRCPRYAELQHDDLHIANLYIDDGRLRILDWGDSCIGHPFVSLVVPFRFLEQINLVLPTDTWFLRLRGAYLEPLGSDRALRDHFGLPMCVGSVAFTHDLS
jgi:hypothetical protein